ncbi:MAG: hypothetical protein U0930_19985 [Pirellulales bacterium]
MALTNLGSAQNADLVIADFEADTYQEWKVTGQAFGNGPAKGTLPNQMVVEGFVGQRLVNSFVGGDNSTGSLTSPEFKIQRNFISFLIGGGKDEEKLALQLWVDGKLMRKATGPNSSPGGSERLAPEFWDVTELLGKSASIRIIDQGTGSWGHLNIDQIVQTNSKPKHTQQNVERKFAVDARYLHLPIKNGGPKRMVTLFVNGKPFVKNEIELADDKPDWWAPMDVSSWKGKSVTLQVDKLPSNSRSLESIEMSDSVKGSHSLYSEPQRGQFHFSPMRGWNNDPNGMVYYNGEYHLFFQHNPYGWSWGNMHWGHAVSMDLVHWEELGDKLLPDDEGPMFSGSAVVDWNNTSGFGKEGKPPLVLLYTAAGNPTVQSLAWSNDGRTFTKSSGNPVLPQITAGNRDPKVLWHADTKQWVMVLYVEKPVGRHTVHILTSANLKEWKVASVVEGDPMGRPFLFECPDLFELSIDGDAKKKAWVLTAANSEYAFGSFDGKKFVPEQTRLFGHRGRGFYAAQTFSDIPASDGRRIQIGWFQTETRGMPFNQSMTIPLELGLIGTEDGPRMTFQPVKELQSLRSRSHQLGAMELSPGAPNPLDKIKAELVELRVEFEPGSAQEIVFNIRDVMVIYYPAKQEISVAGHNAPAPLRNGKQRITIYCDRIGTELFASDGLTYVPIPYNTKAENLNLYFETRGGTAKVLSLDVHELKSAWKKP